VSHLIDLISCGFEEVSAFGDGEEVDNSPSALEMASKLRAARFRSRVLSLEKAISMGLRSGE